MLVFVALVGLPSFGQLKPRAALDYYFGGYNTKAVITPPAYYGKKEAYIVMRYGSYRLRIGADYAIKKFPALALTFDQHVYMNRLRGLSFQPKQAEWYVGAKLTVKKITFKFEHLCIHAVTGDGSYELQTRLYGGYNMLSVSYGY